MSTVRLSIIGAGPLCTYALERLATRLSDQRPRKPLEISIFDRVGRFGSGATHSEAQARTSYLNRVASQIAFAADESVAGAGHLLDRADRPTFVQWCERKLAQTGDRRFALNALDVPRRYLHGEALREAFQRYVDALRSLENVRVVLYTAEVQDVEANEDGSFGLHFDRTCLMADHLLFVTGHSRNEPPAASDFGRLRDHARAHPPCRFIASAYPLEENLTERAIAPGESVAVLGLGLTAIDALLFLTEGRGGQFRPKGPGSAGLRYIPSGREPQIVATSPSGLFTSCRPQNYKATDPTGAAHAERQHRGVFLTSEAIAWLRLSVGRTTVLSDGRPVRQLDFAAHVFPLVILEMAYVYYGTLFGGDAGMQLQRACTARYTQFIKGDVDAGIDWLLHPVEEWFQSSALTYAGRSIERARASVHARTASAVDELELDNVHRFEWRRLFDPLGGEHDPVPRSWRDALIEYMRADHAAAERGNLVDPVKAACDGVWRDLRSVLGEAVDFGGLTANSQREFFQKHLRYYARMSNGTGLEPMSKLLALIESGVVDVSIGPAPHVAPAAAQPLFEVRGARTGTSRQVQIVVDGRAHPFDPANDSVPLYRNLIRRGLMRQWCNPGSDGAEGFTPGGLDVTESFHPIRADGGIERRMTVMGAPIEGVAFFQLSAARPQSGSSILQNAARWAHEFLHDAALA